MYISNDKFGGNEFYMKMENQSRNRNNNQKSLEKNGFQNGSTPIGKSCKCHGSNGLHRFACECLPDHLRFNQYIHTGYRADLTPWECLKSLFYLHNESFNIYSHGKCIKMWF